MQSPDFTSIRSWSLTVMILLLFMQGSVRAQNLVPNWDFETFTACPTTYGMLTCTPWMIPTLGSSDYFNECAPGGVVDVPNNSFTNLPAHSGAGYAGGLYYYAGIPNYREYLQVRLTEPMVAGSSYEVSFYFAVGSLTCQLDKLGMYISNDQLSEPGSTGPLSVTPQLEAGPGLLDNTDWELFSGCYVAHGGEEWIIIGNFYPDNEITLGTGCPLWQSMIISYMFIDDVVIEEGPPPGDLDFTLGEDIVECGEYTIPGPVNGYYTWQDGSHDSDYTVTETGEYLVTITQGCNIGYDTIMVTILEDSGPVDLGGPEEIICPGDVITYNLDPALGDYVWQDNTTGGNYVITTAGTYSVTLTNQCGVYEDAIEVIVLDPPAPIDLGMDTSLCPSETLAFSFDPGLGDFVWQDGSMTPGYTISEPGTYALTISNMCGQVSSNIEVEYYPEPLVLFDDPVIELCEGETIEFHFDPEIGEYLWSDGQDGPDYIVTDPGTYSVTVSNVCGSDFDAVEVIYDYEPQLELGPNVTLCPQQLPYTINLTGLANVEQFVWDDGTTDPDFIIYTAGVYGVTVSNNCFEVWDVIEIFVEDAPPVITLPADTVLCSGDVLYLDVGNVSGDYIWQDGSMGPLYGVTGPGTYSVTVSNACGEDSDEIVVDFMPALPSLDLGPDLNICPGEQAVLSSGVTGVTYLWQDGSTTDSYTVSTADTIILMISNGCASVSDSVIVTVNGAAPQAGLPPTAALCQGDQLTLSSAVGGAMYAWSTGESTSSIVVQNAGTYILTVTNSCGSDIDTTIVTDLGSAPVFDLGSALSLCPGESATLDPGISGTYLWSDGSANPTFIADASGEIFLTVTNACGSFIDSVTVTVQAGAPPLDLGQDTSLCPGESFVLNPAIGGVTYAWSDGSTGSTYTVNGPGEIILEISNNCGMNADTLVVGSLPGIPPLNLGSSFSICPGESVDLAPGIPGVTYLWQDGSTLDTYTVTAAGEIILIIENVCGTATDTIQVTENSSGPTLDLGADISVCAGESVTVMPGVPGVQYLWQDGSTGTSYTTTQSGVIILQVSNACGIARDTIDVTISGNAPVISLGADQLLCDGETLTLSIDPQAGDVLWQDGSTSDDFLITSAGEYTVEVTNQCGVARDTIVVDTGVTPQPVDLGADQEICPGDSVFLEVTGVNPNHILLWNTGASAASIHVDAGVYAVQISSVCGSVTDSVIITEDNRMLQGPAVDRFALCEGESAELDIAQSFDAAYAWSTGASTPTLKVKETGMYVVTVTSDCDALTSEFLVEEGDCGNPNVFIPNVFSPNEDGVNDVFRIDLDARDITEFSVQIYDRWGEQVYFSDSYAFEWDGIFRGKELKPGVYVYYLKITRQGRRPKVISGDVTLVR